MNAADGSSNNGDTPENGAASESATKHSPSAAAPQSPAPSGDEPKKEKEFSMSSTQLEGLEKDFQQVCFVPVLLHLRCASVTYSKSTFLPQVLNELVGDKSLERFRLEYEKLHRALKKSHDNETRLIKKCRELNSEIVANAAKVQTALRLSAEDRNNLAMLKKVEPLLPLLSALLLRHCI